ncbi:hypothetical protein OH492_06700 [Vibrio chagasii]|nr:hypothetical protein [Vibrio chagasii]
MVAKPDLQKGMTIQKSDQRKYMNDEWSSFPAQKVGVKMNDVAVTLWRDVSSIFSS